MTLTAIKSSALKLTAEERAELIDALWEGLEPHGWRDAAPGWAAEAEDRIEAVECGKLPCLDGEAALKILDDSLAK